jgi:nucleoside-diphosphate-sugar epimerase
VVDNVYLKENLLHFLQNQDVILISVAPDSQSDYYTTYFKTSQDVINYLPLCPRLKHIIYTSSTSVYGEHGGAWIDENTPVQPLNPHTQVLCDTEQLWMQQAHSSRHICIVRLGEIYGPGRDFIERLRSRQQPFPGTGENYINIIHRDDIVRAICFATQRHLHGFYNLCNDCHIPRRDFYATLCEQAHLPAIQWDPSLKSPHGGNKRVSSAKIKSLGFQFLY